MSQNKIHHYCQMVKLLRDNQEKKITKEGCFVSEKQLMETNE